MGRVEEFSDLIILMSMIESLFWCEISLIDVVDFLFNWTVSPVLMCQ